MSQQRIPKAPWPTGDDGIIHGLGSEIIVDVHNVSRTDRELLATVNADYSIPGFVGGPGIFVPSGTVSFDTIPGETSGDLLHSDATYRFG